MGNRIRVGLLFGGSTVEHEVSVTSARGVARVMAGTRLECVPLAVTGEGRWLSPELSRRLLEGTGPRAEPRPADDDGLRLAIEPGSAHLLCVGGAGAGVVELDAIFPLVHGWGGEDGRLQGALEQAGLPYVGSGVLGSALAMDKAAAKSVLAHEGIEVVPWILGRRHEHERDPSDLPRRVAAELAYPVFVKPANGGSSVGVAKVPGPAALPAALAAAFRCDRRVLVELAVDALEVECAVIGNDSPRASVPGEIVPSREFYDYRAKYLDGASELHIPARVDPARLEAVRRIALRAFVALDLAGLARVDFLVERTGGRTYLNEVNTLPGFTPISMFPKLWEASGLAYPALVEHLVDLALERALAVRQRRARWEEPEVRPGRS
jgi:D-alanine-D-alanine ligase